jgi:hypothetical protein
MSIINYRCWFFSRKYSKLAGFDYLLSLYALYFRTEGVLRIMRGHLEGRGSGLTIEKNLQSQGHAKCIGVMCALSKGDEESSKNQWATNWDGFSIWSARLSEIRRGGQANTKHKNTEERHWHTLQGIWYTVTCSRRHTIAINVTEDPSMTNLERHKHRHGIPVTYCF